MAKKITTINTSIPFYEIQINGVTYDTTQGFNAIKKSFISCGFTASNRPDKHFVYRVWKIMNGFKYPVPLTAMGG